MDIKPHPTPITPPHCWEVGAVGTNVAIVLLLPLKFACCFGLLTLFFLVVSLLLAIIVVGLVLLSTGRFSFTAFFTGDDVCILLLLFIISIRARLLYR